MNCKQSTFKASLFFLSFLVVSVGTNAQVTVSGKIIDTKDGKPVSFANVVVTSTYKGTTSNIYGDFVLKLPVENANDTIKISAVGFKSKFIPIASCKGKETTFKLDFAQYNLTDVTVKAKTLLYYTIVKKASNRISKNYWSGKPYEADAYYRNKKIVNGSVDKERQAAIKIYDAKGYGKEVNSAFSDVNYKFIQVKRDFKIGGLSDGSSRIDEMLEYDIVRTGQNILHTDTQNFEQNFEVKLHKITESDGDKIWVIKYKCLKPNLALTGDYYASSYSGFIHIRQSDYAVIRNETIVEASNYSELGRSLYVSPEFQGKTPVSIKYTFTTTYAKKKGKYFLNTVRCQREHVWKMGETGRVVKESITTDLMISDVNTTNPEVITNRSYYEEMQYDPKFWENYNFIKDE